MPIASATAPDIIISQIKVTTAGQFITLYNNTDQPINMSTVALQYFNHYLLSSATSTKTISLDGTLPAHGFYMINDGPVVMCYQMSVTSASLGFSTKNGLVQIMKLTQQPGGNVTSETQDFVSWTSGKVSGVQTIPSNPAFLQRQTSNGFPVAGGSWQTVQPSSNDPCTLVTYITPNIPTGSGSGNLLLPPTQPPATIVSVAVASTDNAGIPTSDVGLMAPVLSELLPNPKSPQTDASDEYVEIYNPNSQTFDLSGFKIQTQSSSSSSKSTYTFPNGTKITGKSWAAYPSSNISVSLSNSGSTVSLLDPLGAAVSKADTYTTAKDGMAWALANGKWYWTSTPTPNAANVITAGGSSGSGTSQANSVGTVKGASTSGGDVNNFASSANGQEPAPVHPALLAGVGGLAILYGIYEYRHDIGNWVYRFKRYRESRGKAGKSA